MRGSVLATSLNACVSSGGKARGVATVRRSVSDAELRRVKAQWTASQVYGRDSLFNQAREMGTWWVSGLPLDTSDQLIALLNGVSAEQVQSVAQRYFVDEQLSVAQLIPLPVNPQAPRRSAGHIRH